MRNKTRASSLGSRRFYDILLMVGLNDTEQTLLILGSIEPVLRRSLLSRSDIQRCAELKRKVEHLLAVGAKLDELAVLMPAYAHIIAMITTRKRLDTSDRGSGNCTADRKRLGVSPLLAKIARTRIRPIPFAIELTSGCSVGCWYCGISAGRLQPSREYRHDEFAGVLAALKRAYGIKGGEGVLYWQTDPFDAPMYEKCCELFFETWNVWPFLSTALGARQIDRLRFHIECDAQRNGRGVRVTVNSRLELELLHAHFTAEELLYVNVHVRTPHSAVPLMKVGRAYDALRRSEALQRKQAEIRRLVYGAEDQSLMLDETISCVDGLIVSMPQRTMRYTHPTPASEQNSDGYLIVEERPLKVEELVEFKERCQG